MKKITTKEIITIVLFFNYVLPLIWFDFCCLVRCFRKAYKDQKCRLQGFIMYYDLLKVIMLFYSLVRYDCTTVTENITCGSHFIVLKSVSLIFSGKLHFITH